jgi:hypothetical protein
MKNQADLNAILHSPQAQGLMKNRQALESLMKSGEAQRLMELLNRSAGGGLQNAAQSAMQGDAAQLTHLVEGLMGDPESARLVEELNKKASR